MSEPAKSTRKPIFDRTRDAHATAGTVLLSVAFALCAVVAVPAFVLAEDGLANGNKSGEMAAVGTTGNGAGGDPEHGEKVFQRYCNTCHVTTEGVNRVGPSFHGLYGRRPGTLPSYRSWYSEAMKAYGAEIEVWNEETLFTYLESPRRIVKGTKMGFPGLPDPQDRRDVIAYLKTIDGN